LDSGAVEREPVGELAQGGFGRFPSCGGNDPDDVGLLPQSPIGVEVGDCGELPSGGADRAMEVRRLGVQDAIQLAAERARHLSGLELEECPATADPPEERVDRVAALPGDDAAAASDAKRPRQADLGEPRCEDRRFRWVDDELEVGPSAGQAQRAVGEEPAA
jgi:hypothetical protein